MNFATRVACGSVFAFASSVAFSQVEYTALPGVVLRSVSADGNTAVGYRDFQVPIIWRRATGVQDLPLPDNARPFVLEFSMGVSWSGQRAAGTCLLDRNAGQSILLWDQGVLRELGDIPGGTPVAAESTICGSGEFVVGAGRDDSGLHAIKWSERTGFLSVGLFDDTSATQALACSYDASVLVGYAIYSASYVPWRWSSWEGHQLFLGRGMALSCSADGSVIAGFVDGTSSSGRVSRARIWRGSSILATLTFPCAFGVSADGRLVVGGDNADFAAPGFIWDAAHGARNLRDVAIAQGGQNIPFIASAYGISADGRTIVGDGYVLRLRVPCAGDVDDGTMSGGRDDQVTPDDLSAFIQWLINGDMLADIDNGSGAGIPDAAVTIDDLIYFLGGYEGGC